MSRNKKKGKKFPNSNGKYTRNLKKEILSVFALNQEKTYTPNQIASSLHIRDRGVVGLIREILKDQVIKGKIKKNKDGTYAYETPNMTHLDGIIEITQNARGFVIIDNLEDDVPVSKHDLGLALHGDRVRIAVNANARKMKGRVVQVLERKMTRFVGVLQQSKKFSFFLPTNNKIHVDFFVPNRNLNGAKDGDKVIVEIEHWSHQDEKPEAKVVDVLGRPGNNDVEMHSIMAEYGLPYDFPEHIEREADKIPKEISKEEIAKRKDFRGITTITIDPHDAKDFDDALSYRKLENGNLEIGVHIADVSHYLTKGSILDEEAVSRATSVYLVDRTIPMLPEILSNKLCSLRPKEDKLCFSAVFELNEKAEVKKEWFGKTVIHSDRRFTYAEAQERIETGKGDYAEEIQDMNALARIMRNARFDDGAIDFHSEEVRFNLDEDGKPISVYIKVMKEANQMIEEFMLLANRKVASFIGNPKKGNPRTFVYRVHDNPDPMKLQNLADFVSKFGIKMPRPTQDNAAKVLKDLLKQIRGSGEELIIQPLAIRSMAKAVYTTENVGHFGLGFDFYSHFTSPIRRYPDVIVHRLLFDYLNGGKSAEVDPVEILCSHSSKQEKKAQDAEWASIKYKQVEYMDNQVGKEFKGRITGLTTWGIYVELLDSKCEGMARLEDIEDDYYSFNEKDYVVEGSKHGKQYNLGQEVDIIVKDADLIRRQLDFELIG